MNDTPDISHLDPKRQQQVHTATVAMLTMEQELEGLKRQVLSLNEQVTLERLATEAAQAQLIQASDERDIMRGERDEAVAQRIQTDTFIQLLARQLAEFIPPAPMKPLPARAGEHGTAAVGKVLTRAN